MSKPAAWRGVLVPLSFLARRQDSNKSGHSRLSAEKAVVRDWLAPTVDRQIKQ
jgi:hypothetical protein